MTEWLLSLAPWQQALAGTAFTYFMTALGAGLVFFFKEIKKEVLNLMLGFASGVMIAASFWSLLDPAITKAEENGDIAWLVVSIGFGNANQMLSRLNNYGITKEEFIEAINYVDKELEGKK